VVIITRRTRKKMGNAKYVSLDTNRTFEPWIKLDKNYDCNKRNKTITYEVKTLGGKKMQTAYVLDETEIPIPDIEPYWKPMPFTRFARIVDCDDQPPYESPYWKIPYRFHWLDCNYGAPVKNAIND